MTIPILSERSIEAVAADHQRLMHHVTRLDSQLRFFNSQIGTDQLGQGSVAITNTIIPARVGITPGGPINVLRLRLDNSGLLEAHESVPVYSWVQADSADPADQPNNELYIFIEQDEYGTWWFTAQDCTLVPASIDEATSTANTTADLTIKELELPGSTDLTLAYEGVYQYSLKGELTITGVAGNQYWEVGLGVYNETDASFLAIRDFSGTGTPVQPTWNFSISLPLTVSAADVGDILIIACQRTTTTGTVVVNSGTGHALLGPLK